MVQQRNRKQVMTEYGRQLLQRERQRMAREEAALGEQLVNEAQAQRAMRAVLREQFSPERAAVQRGIVRRIAAVLATEGVLPRLDVQEAGGMHAWTDFSQVVVRYRHEDDIRLMAAKIRGLLYHEGGHIRWTMPFGELRDAWLDAHRVANPNYAETITGEERRQLQRAWNVLEDQRMETAVVSDSPRKAAYFTPVILTEHVSTLKAAAANYPLLVWRRYLPKHIRRGARAAFVAANDEHVALRIEKVVTDYVKATDVVTMYECVCQMRDLLLSIKPIEADINDAGHSFQRDQNEERETLEIPIDPSMEEDDEADVEEDADEQYGSLLDEDPADGASDEPAPMPSPVEDDVVDDEEDEDKGQAPAPAPLSDDAEEDDDDDDDDEAEDAPAPSSDDSDDEDEDEDSDIGGSRTDEDHEFDHTPEEDEDEDDEELTQEALDEAIADAEEERLEDGALAGDVEAYQDAIDNGASMLPPYSYGCSRDGEAVAVADNLAIQIEQSFHEATMDRMPAWVEGQRRGIVNVQRYITRNPGEQEFFRQWVEDDQPGYNIAVSVLLDYSGSMSSHTTALAQVGYACKVACQNLDIPCTVTLWDDKAVTLWDATERAEYLPTLGTNGSTNPDHALGDLPNQRYDKTHHVVLLMTDGTWDGEWESTPIRGGHERRSKRTLAHYAREGQYMIGFGYDGSNPRSADGLAKKLLTKGCPEAYGITNLMEIPRYLENALIALA